jgi:hypothetical protein
VYCVPLFVAGTLASGNTSSPTFLHGRCATLDEQVPGCMLCGCHGVHDQGWLVHRVSCQDTGPIWLFPTGWRGWRADGRASLFLSRCPLCIVGLVIGHHTLPAV